jgi:hypothetical protein
MREHRSTRKIPELVFEAEERPYMLTLNPHPYDTDEVFARNVPPQFHITYETCSYSVPWTLTGLTVTVRACNDWLKFFYNDKQIAIHKRSFKKHQTFTNPAHAKGLLEKKPGGSGQTNWQLKALHSLGEPVKRYLDLLKSGQRSLRFEVSRLLALATVYGEEELVATVNDLLSQGVIGVENLEMALKSRGTPAVQPEPISFRNQKLNQMPEHKDLRHYDQWLIRASDDDPLAETTGDEL